MELRAATVDDVPAMAHIRHVIYPYKVESVQAQRRTFELVPERARMRAIVAEVDGQVVGFSRGLLNWATTQEGAGILAVNVLPSHRNQGIGSALFAKAEAHLYEIGAKIARTWGPPESAGFAEKRGYEMAREMRYSKMDPRVLPPMPAVPDGVKLMTAGEAGIDAVYAFDCVAALDEPGDVPTDNMPKDEWISMYWESPDHQADLGVVAVVDGAVVAGTFVEADLATSRSWSGFTGTLPGYRGRGLAKLVKSDSLRRVAAAGIGTAYTSNDGANGPMLAVNTWLGYRPTASERSFRRALE